MGEMGEEGVSVGVLKIRVHYNPLEDVMFTCYVPGFSGCS